MQLKTIDFTASSCIICLQKKGLEFDRSHLYHPGLVKVSTGVMQVEKLSDADRQTAKLKINANNNRVALAA